MASHYKFDDSGAEIAGSFEYFNRVLYGGHEKDDVQERFFTFAGDTPIFMGAVSDFTRDTWCYQAKNGVLKSGLALTPGHVEGGAKDNFSSVNLLKQSVFEFKPIILLSQAKVKPRV